MNPSIAPTSQAQHTPGPWGRDISGVVSPDGLLIATVHVTAEMARRPEREARRRADIDLIAAAPELLDVLKTCRGNIASLIATNPNAFGAWLAVVDAAIAKAEGRTTPHENSYSPQHLKS